ncbi:MAG: hypothetical protein DMG05_15835 [Acidobacteria bacterium]|nr:MAG: hypothetical protein DMG05_15835 [Acidobacteriota bacterium]
MLTKFSFCQAGKGGTNWFQLLSLGPCGDLFENALIECWTRFPTGDRTTGRFEERSSHFHKNHERFSCKKGWFRFNSWRLGAFLCAQKKLIAPFSSANRHMRHCWSVAPQQCLAGS